MNTIQNKFKILLVLLFAGFALSSCGSDDDGDPDPIDHNDKNNSYSITVEGVEYANSYSMKQTKCPTFI